MFGYFELWLISFFKECPHPDDKQRKELSRELGLEPLQVKFWFQNKRTQMKASSNTPLCCASIHSTMPRIERGIIYIRIVSLTMQT
jgi:hypothetical protein